MTTTSRRDSTMVKLDRAVIAGRQAEDKIQPAARLHSHSAALRQSPANHSSTGAPVAAKFVLTKETSGKFHVNLLASNGRVIATSELYNTRAAAMNGIESIRKNAAGAALDDKTT
jgi:uncharacterized protein YegP (UPF0339 family)